MFQGTEEFSSIQTAEFGGFISGSTLTVLRVLTRQPIIRGMTIRGPGVANGTIIVGELSTVPTKPSVLGMLGMSTPRGGPGRYVVSKPQNVGTGGAPITMTATLVSGPRPDPPGPTPPPPPPPITPGSGQPLRLLPTSHPLYPLTQTNPPGITPANLARLGYAWPGGVVPPPITPGSGRQPPQPPQPPRPDNSQIISKLTQSLDSYNNAFQTLSNRLETAKAVAINENGRLDLANLYVSNIAQIIRTIQDDLRNKSQKNIEIFRKNTEENNRRLDLLTRYVHAGSIVTQRLSSVIRQLNSNSISETEARRQVSEVEQEFDRAREEYNVVGGPRETPNDPTNIMISVPTFPELVFPGGLAPGSSSLVSGPVVLTRAMNQNLYDMIVASPNPAIWEPVLKMYNPPLLYPTDLPGNASTIRATSVTSIAGFSDYKGAIASWTESFAPFEN